MRGVDAVGDGDFAQHAGLRRVTAFGIKGMLDGMEEGEHAFVVFTPMLASQHRDAAGGLGVVDETIATHGHLRRLVEGHAAALGHGVPVVEDLVALVGRHGLALAGAESTGDERDRHRCAKQLAQPLTQIGKLRAETVAPRAHRISNVDEAHGQFSLEASWRRQCDTACGASHIMSNTDTMVLRAMSSRKVRSRSTMAISCSSAAS